VSLFAFSPFVFSTGGGRVWPMAGYWSYSEYQAPKKCVVSEACLGVDLVTAATSATGFFTSTQNCAPAYTGPRCISCSEGYYQLNGRCYFCGSSVDQNRDIIIVVIVGLSAMAFLSLLVALLKALVLAEVMQVFAILQGVAMVGVEGARDSPYYKEQLSTAATYLNFINFDVE
jgi:hypothetical protein